MALTFNPLLPRLALIAIAAVGALLLVLGTLSRLRRGLGRPLFGWLALLLELLALAALLGAAFNPRSVEKPRAAGAHLSVVLDVSESVLRTPGKWDEAKAKAIRLIQANAASLAADELAAGAGSIVTFSSAARGNDAALKTLDAELASTVTGPLANAPATDLSAGLLEASRRIARTGRGAVLLITDGNDTAGGTAEAAGRLAQQGVPVYVLPVTGGSPTLSLDFDVARRTEAGVETNLRGAIYDRGDTAVRASLAYTRNTGLEENAALPVGPTLSDEARGFDLPPGQFAPLHRSLTFQGLGLQYVDVSVWAEDGSLRQDRRFYTFVDRPVRLVAIGGDNSWVAGMPPDGVEITEMKPDAVLPDTDLSQYDAVVVSGVVADRFPKGTLESLAAQVEGGLGLMLLNGIHAGPRAEDPSVLRSYTDTPLDRVLPLTADPRKAPEEAPSRYVAIVLDASGSMGGWKIDKEKEIVAYAIKNLLTRRDTLDLIVFTAGAERIVKDLPMTDANKEEALRALDSFGAGGGTDPREAVKLVQTGKECNLLFLSDGEFDRIGARPDCKCAGFSIAGAVGPGSTIDELCQEVYAVDPNFNPATVGLQSLKRKTRTKFWEAGVYLPRTVSAPGITDQLLVPALPLDGSAIAYKKPEADVLVFRPKLADPVLAYRDVRVGDAPGGVAGTLVTAFPAAWLSAADGQAAVRDWLLRVVPYAARTRYDFAVDDLGRALKLQIAVLPENGVTPEVSGLGVQLEAGGRIWPIAMAADPAAPGVFSGRVDVSRDEVAQQAVLIITEEGPGALARPQRVPLLLPPAGQVTNREAREANTWGVNEQLLSDLAQATGGLYNPPPDTVLLRSAPPPQRGNDLWPFLALAAAWCYLAAIFLRRRA